MAEITPEQLKTALSDARHTISNPLTVISGNAQLLLQMAEMMELDDEFIEPLKDINDASEEMERLINDVYDVEAFLENGNERPQSEVD